MSWLLTAGGKAYDLPWLRLWRAASSQPDSLETLLRSKASILLAASSGTRSLKGVWNVTSFSSSLFFFFFLDSFPRVVSWGRGRVWERLFICPTFFKATWDFPGASERGILRWKGNTLPNTSSVCDMCLCGSQHFRLCGCTRIQWMLWSFSHLLVLNAAINELLGSCPVMYRQCW